MTLWALKTLKISAEIHENTYLHGARHGERAAEWIDIPLSRNVVQVYIKLGVQGLRLKRGSRKDINDLISYIFKFFSK